MSGQPAPASRAARPVINPDWGTTAPSRYRAELPTGEVLVARSQSGIKAQIRSALMAEAANCVLAA